MSDRFFRSRSAFVKPTPILCVFIAAFCFGFSGLIASAQVVLLPGESVEKPGAASTDRQGGCMMASQGVLANNSNLFLSSGSQVLDAALSTELQQLRSAFGVNPFFALYDDSGSPNAFARPSSPGKPYGMVIFGRVLMSKQLQVDPYKDFTVIAIMAHEFGHIVQFQNSLSFPGKFQELQADYFAGWYMGNRERNSPHAMEAVVQSTTDFFQKGDYGFTSKDHHGTPDERKQAVMEGFLNYQYPLNTAISRSVSYIKSKQE